VKPECTDYKFADVERQLTKGVLNHGGNLCKYLKHLMLPKGNVLTEGRAPSPVSRCARSRLSGAGSYDSNVREHRSSTNFPRCSTLPVIPHERI
jgi:hypothetical protein